MKRIWLKSRVSKETANRIKAACPSAIIGETQDTLRIPCIDIEESDISAVKAILASCGIKLYDLPATEPNSPIRPVLLV